MGSRRRGGALLLLTCVALAVVALFPSWAWAADEAQPTPIYQTVDELAGKRIAYVNGSVYHKAVESRVDGTVEQYYPSLADCAAAVEAGKADAAVQLSCPCQLVVNRKGGTMALVPEHIADVDEAYFFPKGDPLVEQFNEVIAKLKADGTLDVLMEEWTAADETNKELLEQDWDAPNGTLSFATTGVLEPLSYVGDGGDARGYDVDLALYIARELGYRLDISTIPMDAIIAGVEAGKVDFGGSLTVTPERAESVDFTDSITDLYISALVPAEGAETVSSVGFVEGIKKSFERTFIEENRWQLILSGLGVTLLISVCAGFLGLALGFVTVQQRRRQARWAVWLVDGYQAIMGGVPIVVILMVLYYVVFGSMNVAGELVAIIAFGLAFGSAAGATMWTAVKGIEGIQEETGLALGFNSKEVFHLIIFPQAIVRFAPQLVGQFVSLVKDSSVVGFIAVQDLTRASDLIRARTMDAFFPLITTAIIYFVICRVLAWALGKLAARLDPSQRPHEIKGVQ